MRPEHDDAVTVHTLKAALESLANGDDPVLRDLAIDVLAERLSLADIAANSEIIPKLQQAIEGYADWRASLSDEEFEQKIAEAQELHRRIPADGETDA